MKLILFIILFILCISEISFAQDSEEYRDKIVGVSVSTLSGLALYITTDLTYEDNLKVSFLVLPDQSEDDFFIQEYESETVFSFGIEYQRDLLESKRLRLHFLTGAGIDNTLYRFEDCYDSNTNCFFTNAGIGLGFDIEIVKGFIINIHTTYQLSQSHGDINDKFYGFGGGIGLGIHLKQK